MCQILKLRQIRQLKIQRVYNKPAINRHRNENNPDHRHSDVVEENQIVDNGEEEECEESEADEHTEAPQPWNDFILIFLMKEIQ